MADPKGIAVITGASSGIGEVYADRLAKQGYDLILIARGTNELARVAAHIWSTTGRSAELVSADLTNAADLLRVERLLAETPDITVLVNSAGVGSAGMLLISDPDEMTDLISLNVNAVMRLTYAVVPNFVDRGSGTIINIGSGAALRPELLNGVYGGAKAFVLAFSESLKHELEGTGVRVQIVLPGATATNFWNRMGVSLDALEPEWLMTPEDLVDAALAGLERGEFVTIPSLEERELWNAFEKARHAMFGKLSKHDPAARYRRAAA
jgi:uncharacterized protein